MESHTEQSGHQIATTAIHSNLASMTFAPGAALRMADVIPQEKREAAMAVFAVVPLLGPVIGPVKAALLLKPLDGVRHFRS